MAFPAETLPSQGYQAEGFIQGISSKPDFSPLPETEAQYNHQLQARVAGEWIPLLLENGEGSLSRRVAVFRDRVDSFASFTNELTEDQLDGGMDPKLMDKVVQEASHIKIAAMGVGTRLGIDVGSFMDKKMLEKMQEKYPPDSIYALITSGLAPLEAMGLLKSAYNNGHKPFVPSPEISPAEQEYRLPRVPAYKDPYQDITDAWQRRAFGIYLRPVERLPNLFGESQELLEEFNGMSEADVNSLAGGRLITADEPQGKDVLTDKRIAIAGEIADVSIALDGYTATLDRDQEIDANAALDATIQRYRKTGRLVGEGYSEQEAMDLLRKVDHRVRVGARLPYVKNPTVAAIIAAFARN